MRVDSTRRREEFAYDCGGSPTRHAAAPAYRIEIGHRPVEKPLRGGTANRCGATGLAVRSTATPRRRAGARTAPVRRPLVATLLPVGVALLLVPLRGRVSAANLALVVVLAVLAGAVIGGRAVGALSGI